MKTKSEIAAKKFLEGYNCAQSVFYSFCDDLIFDKNIALKMACGFGGGMGRKEEVCGAVTGGIIVLGAKYGRGEKEDRAATELTYKKTRELHGSVFRQTWHIHLPSIARRLRINYRRRPKTVQG